jgi:hypothetical protein
MVSHLGAQQNRNTVIDEYSPYHINPSTLGYTPIGGDTLFIASTRELPIRFQNLNGNAEKPIVVINQGGQVQINATRNGDWGALVFYNTTHIKLSGQGHPGFKFGFKLEANEAGLAFVEYSSDCEAEFIKISHDGFFGIVAKKDFNGNPPSPYPVFRNLLIHDCFIENVHAGMYLGETKSPGMEFRHVRVYNNIVRNTRREAIQIANMVEDIEIYNNTLINTGLDGLRSQSNILQIGDNSVVRVYNNILMGAPEYGVINFGKGHTSFFNNYIVNTKGFFCDNRLFSVALAPIEIRNNYIKDVTGDEVVKNMNEVNFLTATHNTFNTPVDFYNDRTSEANEIITNNTQTEIHELSFQNPAQNNYALSAETPAEFLGMGAPGGPEAFDYFVYDPPQIVITESMISDEVFGGSVNSPKFLFDEQDVDLERDQQPVSASWLPANNMNDAPYHTIVDLGDEYRISKMSLHDMHGTQNFTVAYYADDTWKTLFIESCERFRAWQRHSFDIKTRYLRFSMYDSPYAGVNEILVYGERLIKQSSLITIDPNMLTDLVAGGSLSSPQMLFDEQQVNPANQEHPVSASWQPSNDNSQAPYIAEVDLGCDYHISQIYLHDMNETAPFVIEYKQNGIWKELLTEPCDARLVWKIHDTDIVGQYLRLVMPESPDARVNELLFYGYPVMTLPATRPPQIVVETHMVYDLVSGGSVDAPTYLFDEQYVDAAAGEHPVSKNWKPYYNNSRAPYYTEVHLEASYHITEVLLHDMHATDDFIIEYMGDTDWLPFITESCDAFEQWKVHEVNVTTNKLRLSMLDGPYAGVNEILLFGLPVEDQASYDERVAGEDTANLFSETIELEMYPNPVQHILYVKGIGTNASNSHISIVDGVLGQVLFETDHAAFHNATTIQIPVNYILKKSGIYILHYRNDIGQEQTFKFVKDPYSL